MMTTFIFFISYLLGIRKKIPIKISLDERNILHHHRAKALRLWLKSPAKRYQDLLKAVVVWPGWATLFGVYEFYM